MPRARNLKHDFFLDDELAEHDPLERIFFAALWCLADYKGDIEWRPKKVKTQTLPYDDIDIEKIAINLDKSRFIRFYSDGKKVYLNIRKFSDHQNPHKNERDKGSDIPEYSEKLRQLVDLKGLTIIRDKSRLNHDENETDPADSLFLIPDSCTPKSNGSDEPAAPKVADFDSEKAFDEFWNAYPSRTGSKGSKKKSKAKFKSSCKSQDDFELIMAGLANHVTAWNNPDYIPMVTTWLNGDCWNDDVAAPKRNGTDGGLDWS